MRMLLVISMCLAAFHSFAAASPNHAQGDGCPKKLHSKACEVCVQSKRNCHYCGENDKDEVAKIAGLLQVGSARNRLQCELVKRLLPRVRFYTYILYTLVPHKPGVPVGLAAIEYKDAEDRNGAACIVGSTKDLSDLLVRHKLSGDSKEVALCAAVLTQEIWWPANLAALLTQKRDGIKWEASGDDMAWTFDVNLGGPKGRGRVLLAKGGAFKGVEVTESELGK